MYVSHIAFVIKWLSQSGHSQSESSQNGLQPSNGIPGLLSEHIFLWQSGLKDISLQSPVPESKKGSQFIK